MNLQKTQFVQRTAAKLAQGLTAERVALGAPPAKRKEILHEKSAKTVVGGILVALGCLLLFGGLAGIGAVLYLKLVEPSLLVFSFLFAPAALGVVFIILGAVNISGELKDTLGWFRLFVGGFVALFRRSPAP